ncbi:helix-turn-helix domain-containing protein [Streptomyces sp. NPDC047061]|uniref:IclR family transcriptional regulator n=1 Tax=Streptomyces sp. NPDC047061 TaxID=3154605 RepID=UPI003402A154
MTKQPQGPDREGAAESPRSASKGAVSESAGGSLTLERGLRVLTLLGERPLGLTVSAISEEMGTHRAGIYRLLKPLEAANLVERRPDGRYTLGLGLLNLAANVRSRLQEVAAHELQELANKLSCTCALTIRLGEDGVVAIVQEPVVSRMHIAYRPGLRHPLTQAASGLAILAGDIPRPGERPEITKAREVGYAVTRDELFTGASGVAVPVLGPEGRATASVSVVWLGVNPDESRAIEALQACAARIMAALPNENGERLTQPISRK